MLMMYFNSWLIILQCDLRGLFIVSRRTSSQCPAVQTGSSHMACGVCWALHPLQLLESPELPNLTLSSAPASA